LKGTARCDPEEHIGKAAIVGNPGGFANELSPSTGSRVVDLSGRK
jgi:hypothetical protein